MLISSLPGNFNFHTVGNSVAVDLMFTQDQPSFGSASLISAGTLYIYGCGVPTNSADKGCKLAKVDPENVLNRGAWAFYAGNENWSSRLSDAISVIPDANILSVSWNDYLQEYVAIYSQLLSNNVAMRTAPNPEGPWSDEGTAFVAMPPTSGNVYDARSHSEYDLNGGQTVFVTYPRSTGAFTSEVRLVSLQLQQP